MTPVAVRLREFRTARHLSQAALAERAGVPQSTVSRIETGRTKGIDFATLDKLARALGCQPGHLIVSVKGRPRKE